MRNPIVYGLAYCNPSVISLIIKRNDLSRYNLSKTMREEFSDEEDDDQEEEIIFTPIKYLSEQKPPITFYSSEEENNNLEKELPLSSGSEGWSVISSLSECSFSPGNSTN